MEEKMNEEIPKTDSIQKLAEFWDTHDITDFENDLEEVQEPVFERDAETVLTIRLHSQEAEKLRKIAEYRGLEDTTLLREWVIEKLQST